MKHVIIDYDVGNLASVQRGFLRAGIETTISKDPDVIKQATSLILPGVGAFKDAMDALQNSGTIPLIYAHVQAGKALFGICLGMQLLYERSHEYGIHEGLGLLPGEILYIGDTDKVPHMGWNNLSLHQPNHPLLKYIQNDDYVYFVHSYYAKGDAKHLLASTLYQVMIPAIVAHKNIYATQFHPEKSGEVGLNLLKAYGELIK